MQSRFSQSLFVALSLSVLFTSILFAQSKPLPAQRWEYFTKQVCSSDKEELNKYGDEGWELVVVVAEPTNSCGHYTFKRLKSANAPRYVDPNERPTPTSNPTTCNITLAQVPTIRGLRLGMTVDEVLSLFPGTDPNYVKKRIEETQGEPYFGVTSLDLGGSQHQERDQSLYFQITLLDKRVVAVSSRYTINNHTNYGQVFTLDQFIDKIATTYKLPTKENWVSDKNYSDRRTVLRCKEVEFQLDLIGRIFSLMDPSYLEKQKQRMAEALAKKRAEFKP